MTEPETPLAQAERHVAELEIRLAVQARIVAKLERDDYSEAASLARDVLAQFHVTLDLAKRHAAFEREQER